MCGRDAPPHGVSRRGGAEVVELSAMLAELRSAFYSTNAVVEEGGGGDLSGGSGRGSAFGAFRVSSSIGMGSVFPAFPIPPFGLLCRQVFF